MISKDKLKNKFVTYLDKDGKYRTHRVTRITGKTLTVKDIFGVKHRIHPDKCYIFGRQKKKEKEGIIW